MSDFANQLRPLGNTTTHSSGAVYGATTAPPVGHVSRAFADVDQLIEGLVQTVIQLRERLENGGALMPSAPSVQAGSDKDARPVMSGLVARLADQQTRLAIGSSVVSDILQRLDL